MSLMEVSKKTLQLLGIACLFIASYVYLISSVRATTSNPNPASKYIGKNVPSVNDLVLMSDRTYNNKEVHVLSSFAIR